jgi:hypothetical protein
LTAGAGAIALDGRGVNETGLVSGNALAVADVTLAWLQDVPAQDAFGRWDVTLRDVVVLDPFGRVHAIMNLTVQDLNQPAHYAALRALLLAAAAAAP